MLPQTENTNQSIKETSSMLEALKKEFLKNLRVIREYWPILLLMQIPLVMVYKMVSKPASIPPVLVTIDKKITESQKQQGTILKSLEQRVEELNQRFLVLQNQHTKIVKSLISIKSYEAKAEHSAIKNTQKTALDTLDRIGEKIRLNEPFAGLLASLPKECLDFSGYKTLHKYSTKLPLNYLQIKNAFDELYKNRTTQTKETFMPLWLTKIASFFHGKVQVKKTNDVNPLQPINEAISANDLRLALVLAKNLNIANVKLWAQLAEERILLEDEYSVFADNVQNWTQIQEDKT